MYAHGLSTHMRYIDSIMHTHWPMRAGTEARTSALTSTRPHSCPQQSHAELICIPNNFPYARC